MKAEELRIGNFIMDSDTERVGHVVRISEKKVSAKLEHSTLWQDIGEFEPIPLSEEVLLKCGFKCNKHGGIFAITEFPSVICIYKDGDTKWNDRYIDCKILYLHQLQNLFYSLTGEELEVKWS